MEANCKNEIVELHRFFEEWFKGLLPNSPENLARFTSVLGREFEIIDPDGERTDRETLCANMIKAHGSCSNTPFRIWVENIRLRSVEPNVHLATYQEWQQTGMDKKGRLSSVVFRKAAHLPNQVEWAHIHEVWLPE